MKNFQTYIKNKWFKLLAHFLLGTSIVSILVFDRDSIIYLISKISLSLSFLFSIYFTINITLDFSKDISKTVNKQRIEISELNYANKTYKFNNMGTLNLNALEREELNLPELTIDLIKYHVNLHPLAPLSKCDKIIFDEAFVKDYGKVTYVIIGGPEALVSHDMPKLVDDYIKNAEWLKLENGHALVEKTKHLLGFRFYNFGDKPLAAFSPFLRNDNIETVYKTFNPILLKPKEEVTVFILLLNLKSDAIYNLRFRFYLNNKCYWQGLELSVKDGDLRVPLILTKTEECTPTTDEN